MRVKHQSSQPRNSLKLLGIFLIVVFVLIVISLGYRLFQLISISKFDSSHTFVIAFQYKSDVDFIAIRPHNESVSHLAVRGAKSAQSAEQAAGILSDATITLNKPFDDSEQLSHYFFQGVFGHDLKTDLTAYDLFRLGFVTRGLSKEQMESEHLTLPATSQFQLPQNFFSDISIVNENKSIAIINGTGVIGLGTKLEYALSQMGGNVISVTNSNDEKEKSQISFTGGKSYTLEHLGKMLNLTPTMISEGGLSDIIITIGKDRIKEVLY